MPGFDDDPFDKPFADSSDVFGDPSITQVTRNTQNMQNSLEDYNPFDNERPRPQTVVNPTNNVAVVQTSNQTSNAVPPNQNAKSVISTDELQRRQEELERRAAELDRREQQLNGANIQHTNNWPPLPEKCCFQPCFYQDINVDIPPEFQRVVRHLYYAWMFYIGTMCLNIIGGLILLLHTGAFATFGLAIFYTFLFTPASYLCWFRPVYKAFRNDSSFNFMVFFFVYFSQTCLSIFQVVGMNGSGYCGFITAISHYGGSAGDVIVGILLTMIAMCFAVCATANILMITKVHSIYRSTGASMAKAQAEFTSEFMRNQNVQQAASSAMQSAVSSQFNTNSNNSSRY
ncbi:SCAMP2 family protein [Megaselia abdita]